MYIRQKAVFYFVSLTALALFTSCPGGGGGHNAIVQGLPAKVCVAWAENDAGSVKQVYVKCKQFGSAWIQYGGSMNINPLTSAGYIPSVAIDLLGLPYVAWGEAGNIYVKHFNISTLSWELVGSAVDSSGLASTPKISVGADGAVAVAYLKDDTPFNLYVRQWDGAAWQLMGPGSLNIDIAMAANGNSLAVVNAGLAYVAWHENNGTYSEVYVKQWNGGVWTRLPSNQSLNIAASGAWFPVIAADDSGAPYVTFRQGGDVYTVYWDSVGAAWVTLGGAPVNGASSVLQPLLAIASSGAPYVTWDENYLYYAARWDGATWQALGTGSLNTPSATNYTTGMTVTSPVYPSSSSEMPILYWVEKAGINPYNVTTKYWDGAAWQNGDSLNVNPAPNTQPVGSISSR